MKSAYYKSIFFLLFSVFIGLILSGCSTPGLLKQVKWKRDKNALDYAIDHYEMGLKYESAGIRPDAIKEYQESLKLSPRPVVYYQLGILYAAEEQYDLASTNLQKAVELSPGFEEAKKELLTLQSIQKPPAE